MQTLKENKIGTEGRKTITDTRLTKGRAQIEVCQASKYKTAKDEVVWPHIVAEAKITFVRYF